MSKSSFSSFPVDNRRKLDRFAIDINAFYNKFQYIHTSSLKSPFTTININNRLCISISIDEPLPFIHRRYVCAVKVHRTPGNEYISFFYDILKPILGLLCKGQLISEAIFLGFKCPKMEMKFFEGIPL